MKDTQQLAPTFLKSFDNPDEVRTFDNGKVELVRFEGSVIGRATLQPGWKWSQDVKHLVGTRSCQAPHFQYQLSGRMHVVMDDGSQFETGPGDVSLIQPGHDAWVIGDEPVVVVDWSGMEHYAERLKK